MNDTNWDGKITQEMFDLSQVGTNYETFDTLTKRYLINCLVGNAHLTGDGSLLDGYAFLWNNGRSDWKRRNCCNWKSPK